MYAAVAISVVTGLYLVKQYFAGGVCRSNTRLTGKVIIVTGANTGIGKTSAKDFVQRGGRVILACRSELRGEAAVEEIRQCTGSNNVIFKRLDLSSFQSIREFSNDIINNEERLDILVNNAGCICTTRTVTKDGLEMIMGVNHFGHFLLTNLLLDKLKTSAPSRIVNVSSIGHNAVKSINFDDIQNEIDFNGINVYCQSKLANVLFTRELAKRLKIDNVTVNVLHPGVIRTEIWGYYYQFLKYFIAKLIIYPIVYIFYKSSTEGAQTTIHVAVSDEVKEITGQYFKDCKRFPLAEHALDDEAAAKLWVISEKLTKLK